MEERINTGSAPSGLYRRLIVVDEDGTLMPAYKATGFQHADHASLLERGPTEDGGIVHLVGRLKKEPLTLRLLDVAPDQGWRVELYVGGLYVGTWNLPDVGPHATPQELRAAALEWLRGAAAIIVGDP